MPTISLIGRLRRQEDLRRLESAGGCGHHGIAYLRHSWKAASGTAERGHDPRSSRKSPWDNLVFTADPPRQILERLEAQGYGDVVLAGGTCVNSLFAREGLIDAVVVTLSPKIFGTGLGLFSPDVAMDLSLEEVERAGSELVVLSYRVLQARVSETPKPAVAWACVLIKVFRLSGRLRQRTERLTTSC